MKKLSFLIVALLFSATIFSQESGISFKETTHDFGTVSEDAGKISYDFEFTNTGNTPVALTNVKASCGCTTPEWTKEPVAPGKKGTIKVTYTTTGRPYKFNKPVTVTSSANGVTSTTTLYIKGDVTPKSQSPNFQATSATSFEGLSLSKNQLSFSLVQNDKKMEFIELENKGNSSVKIEMGKTPDYITVTSNVKELKPGAKETLVIVCDASKIKKEGTYDDSFVVLVSGDSDKKINQKISIHTVVKN